MSLKIAINISNDRKKLTQDEELSIVKECVDQSKYNNLIKQYTNLIIYIISNTLEKENVTFDEELVEKLLIETLHKLLKDNAKLLAVYYKHKNSGMPLSIWIALVTQNIVKSSIHKANALKLVFNDKS